MISGPDAPTRRWNSGTDLLLVGDCRVQTHLQLQQICGELSSLKDEVSNIEAQTVQLKSKKVPARFRG